jgi:hypothetical protein
MVVTRKISSCTGLKKINYDINDIIQVIKNNKYVGAKFCNCVHHPNFERVLTITRGLQLTIA